MDFWDLMLVNVFWVWIFFGCDEFVFFKDFMFRLFGMKVIFFFIVFGNFCSFICDNLDNFF